MARIALTLDELRSKRMRRGHTAVYMIEVPADPARGRTSLDPRVIHARARRLSARGFDIVLYVDDPTITISEPHPRTRRGYLDLLVEAFDEAGLEQPPDSATTAEMFTTLMARLKGNKRHDLLQRLATSQRPPTSELGEPDDT
ncbi:hypothetical protein [Demequina sp. SO4-18]|uniref:hypothetical protein n=1 Tax=Demequina sp. SO4-18 TaxID=3401026 RepID=UPI003B59D75D